MEFYREGRSRFVHEPIAQEVRLTLPACAPVSSIERVATSGWEPGIRHTRPPGSLDPVVLFLLDLSLGRALFLVRSVGMLCSSIEIGPEIVPEIGPECGAWQLPLVGGNYLRVSTAARVSTVCHFVG